MTLGSAFDFRFYVVVLALAAALGTASSAALQNPPAAKPAEAKESAELVKYKGRTVTVEERDALENGLVKYKDRWVTPEEKKSLEKGLVPYGGRWVTAKDKEQYDKGLLPVKGKWIARAEANAAKAKWEDAWELSGPHFFVRTNANEEVGSELLTILEAAYPHFKRFYAGAEPPKTGSKKNKSLHDVDVPEELLPVFVFREKAEYEAHCDAHNAPEQVTSPGYFDSATEVYVTYDAGQGRQQLLSTTVGAMTDVYCWFAWDDRMPEWFSEGAKRYFESFSWDGQSLKFGKEYPSLMQAIKDGEKIPLKRMLRVTIASIAESPERWVWAGECWGLIHLFQSDAGKPFAKSWNTLCTNYRAKVNFTDMKGAANTNEAGAKIFEDAFGKEMEALEKAMFEHVASMSLRK